MTVKQDSNMASEKSAAAEEGAPSSAGEALASSSANNSSNNPKTLSRKLSISEEATLASSGRLRPPKFLKCIMETPFRTKNPTHGEYVEEVTGWAMDGAGRGPLNQAGSYLGVAVITLATMDAGCTSLATCDTRVYGLQPSSMLTIASVVTGVASALLMPLIGAIVDHTRHRKTVGVLTAILVCAVTAFQISISLETWFACLILEMVGGFALIMHFTSVMAYLPDLTELEYGEHDLSHYTSRFNIVMYVFQLFYAGLIIGVSYGMELNSIDTAKAALAGAAFFATILFGYAWLFLFRKRPALSEVKEGDNLVTSGFKQLHRTSTKIITRYRSLKWFMFALMWTPEAGAGVVLSITVTYLTVIIGMKGVEIGITNMILLVATVPGSLFANWFGGRFNPLNSFRWGLIYLSLCVALTVVVIDGPEKKPWTYLFAALWGFAYGWIFPSQRTLQVTLTPRGQETEIMGLFAFATQVIGWLPALLFSIMNENGVDMRWGVSIIAFELWIAIFILCLVGNYDDAVKEVQIEAAKEEMEMEQEEVGNGLTDSGGEKEGRPADEEAPVAQDPPSKA